MITRYIHIGGPHDGLSAKNMKRGYLERGTYSLEFPWEDERHILVRCMYTSIGYDEDADYRLLQAYATHNEGTA